MQFTLTDLWAHMGILARLIVGVLLLMSMISVVVCSERLVALRASKRESVRFAGAMADTLRAGDLDKAAAADVGKDVGHLGRVIQAGLGAYRASANDDEELAFESVTRALERQAQREVHTMKRGLGSLATIASTAPFVGLLGTVMGIVNAFQLMAAAGSGGLGTVSAGISEALVTTALGLVVAIPAVGAYNGLQSSVDALAVDISESSNELLDVVARNLRRRHGRGALSAAS